jgi:hypothetical protein
MFWADQSKTRFSGRFHRFQKKKHNKLTVVVLPTTIVNYTIAISVN